MNTELHYGRDSSVSFDLPDTLAVVERGRATDAPIANVGAALVEGLRAPLNFPPLAQAIVPGDQIAIALDAELPSPATFVSALIDELLANEVEPTDIVVVITPEMAERNANMPLAELDAEIAERITLDVHEPTDRDRLSFLAVSAEGKAIYINRRLADADVVIPLGCLRVDEAIGYHGIHSELFPALADHETRERFRAPSIDDVQVTRRRRRDEVLEAVRHLGVAWTVQVIPAGDDGVREILVGDLNTIAMQGPLRCEAAWKLSIAERASLVVAAISGDARNQTWENVGRALASARRGVRDGGAIALVTELAERPGPAVQRILGAPNDEDAHGEIVREIRKLKTPDAAFAAQLLLARDQAKLYLLSKLDEDMVYDLGIAAVEEADDLSRLATRHDSCLLLSHSQYAVVVAEDEAFAAEG